MRRHRADRSPESLTGITTGRTQRAAPHRGTPRNSRYRSPDNEPDRTHSHQSRIVDRHHGLPRRGLALLLVAPRRDALQPYPGHRQGQRPAGHHHTGHGPALDRERPDARPQPAGPQRRHPGHRTGHPQPRLRPRSPRLHRGHGAPRGRALATPPRGPDQHRQRLQLLPDRRRLRAAAPAPLRGLRPDHHGQLRTALRARLCRVGRGAPCRDQKKVG